VVDDLGFLLPFKNPTASARFEPANLGIRGQHTTSAPPKPLRLMHFKLWLTNCLMALCARVLVLIR
jgi:hypothetical protein